MPSCLINDREIYYLDQGEGFPLLLGHSFLWDSRAWAPQLQLLSEHFRCIVPDLWSHGQSGTLTDGDLSVERLAEDNHLLMQQLGIERYCVIGMATGGLWGAKLAMKYPDEVAGLSLIACYLGSESVDNQEDYLELLNVVEQLDELPPALVDVIVKIFFTEELQALHPALVETFRFDLMFLSPEQISGVVAMGKALFQRPSLLEQATDIRCPVQILAGRHDIPYPMSLIEQMHQQMPDSQFSIIENAGHMPTLEQPDQVNPLLINFLASLEDIDLDVSKVELI